jgi:hypothetical protein
VNLVPNTNVVAGNRYVGVVYVVGNRETNMIPPPEQTIEHVEGDNGNCRMCNDTWGGLDETSGSAVMKGVTLHGFRNLSTGSSRTVLWLEPPGKQTAAIGGVPPVMAMSSALSATSSSGSSGTMLPVVVDNLSVADGTSAAPYTVVSWLWHSAEQVMGAEAVRLAAPTSTAYWTSSTSVLEGSTVETSRVDGACDAEPPTRRSEMPPAAEVRLSLVMSSLVSEAGVLGLTMAAVSRGTRKDAVELVRTVAGVESSDGAAAETLEDVVDLVVEMPCEEVGEEVAVAGSPEVEPLGPCRGAVERVVDGAVLAAARARAR